MPPPNLTAPVLGLSDQTGPRNSCLKLTDAVIKTQAKIHSALRETHTGGK